MVRKKSGINKLNIFKTSSAVSGSRSYMSLAYGVLAIIVIFAIVFLGLRALSQRNADIGEEAGQTGAENVYVVKEGDSLWTIAEEVYNDGFKWTIIAEENSLERPDAIETGMSLIIPEITQAPTVAMEDISPTPALSEAVDPETPDEGKITGNSYTVVLDDNLWSIAVRAYGDGYKWVDIAKANKLVNPDLIHAGNKFTLPR